MGPGLSPEKFWKSEIYVRDFPVSEDLKNIIMRMEFLVFSVFLGKPFIIYGLEISGAASLPPPAGYGPVFDRMTYVGYDLIRPVCE